MLLQSINKKIATHEDAYVVYIGLLQAVTNLKITDQEKKVLSIILRNGKLTKEVKAELETITSKPRIENIISKLRAKKILVGDTPSAKFPKIKFEDTTFSITLKPNENTANK